VLLLAACGGGGDGGGGGGSPSDPSTVSGLTVSPASISFTATQGAIPPTQNIQITISQPDAAYIGVGFPPSVTPPEWLDRSPSRLTGAGNNWTFTAAILSTPLAPGTYTTTVRIVIADINKNILEFRDVQVSYTIQPLTGFAANPQSLSFSQLQGGPAPAAQNLGISELGGASYAWTASIVYQSGSGWLNINGASSASGVTLPTSLSISVNSSSTLGTRNAIVHFTGNGNAIDVPVSYTVSQPQITPSLPGLTFNTVNLGPIPPAQNLTLTTQGSIPVNYVTSVTYAAGATDWLTVSASGTAPGSLSFGVNTNTLTPGRYQATVVLTTATQIVSLSITNAVQPSSLTGPGILGFTLTPISPPSELSLNFDLGSSGAPLTWTGTVSVPWMTLSPATGTTPTQATLSLVPAQVDTLDFGFRRGPLAFSYTPPNGAFTTQQQMVDFELLLPKVTSVIPYVATSGTTKEVIVRGVGFTWTIGQPVLFGTTPVSAYTVVSDTEIHVTHPSLTPGTYRVSIANHLNNPGIVRSTANLVVLDAPAYAAATIAYPNATAKQPLDIIYDAERQALLVGVAYPTPGSSGEIFRYPFTGSAWATAPASVSVTSFRDFALSLDGKRLIALSDFAVQQVDVTALTTGPVTPTLVVELVFKGVAMANDGNAVLSTIFPRTLRAASSLWLYSVRDPKITLGGGISLVQGTPGSSADGSRVVLSHASPDSTGSYIGQYDSSSGAFSFIPSSVPGTPSTWPGTSIRPKLDRKATRLVMNGYIVIKNSDYSHPSFLPQPPGDSAAVALSPDGMRAYQYVSGALLRTFDVSSPDQGVSEIGAGIVLLTDPGANPVMTVSPDGGTLFIAGANAIVVVPAP